MTQLIDEEKITYLLGILEKTGLNKQPDVAAAINALHRNNLGPLRMILKNPLYKAFLNSQLAINATKSLKSILVQPTRAEAVDLNQGHCVLGTINKYGDVLSINFNDLCNGFLNIGATGSGKSVLARNILNQAGQYSKELGFNIICIDNEKNEFRGLVDTGNFIVITFDQFMWNILKKPNGMSLYEYKWMLTEIITSQFFLQIISRRTIKAILETLYRMYGSDKGSGIYPYIAEVVHAALHFLSKTKIRFDQESYARVANRLDNLAEIKAFECRDGIDPEIFIRKNIILELGLREPEIKNFIASLIVRYLYTINVKKGLIDNKLRHLVFVEEARGLLDADRNTGLLGDNSFDIDVTRVRAAGVGLFINTQQPPSVSQSVKSNAYIVNCHRLSDGVDIKSISETLGLTDEETHIFKKLPPHGASIIRHGKYDRPYLLKGNPPSVREYVNDDELAEMMSSDWQIITANYKPIEKYAKGSEQEKTKTQLDTTSNTLVFILGHSPYSSKSDLRKIPGFHRLPVLDKGISQLIEAKFITEIKIQVSRTRASTFYPLEEKAYSYLNIKPRQGHGSFRHQLFQHIVNIQLRSEGYKTQVEGRFKKDGKAIDIKAISPTGDREAYEVCLDLDKSSGRQSIIDNIVSDFRDGAQTVVVITANDQEDLAKKTILTQLAMEPNEQGLYVMPIWKYHQVK